MRTEATVAKWGNSLAVRIPQPIARQAHLNEGDAFTLEVGADGNLILRPARPRYDLASLLEGVTAKNLHSEADWGVPAGKETW